MTALVKALRHQAHNMDIEHEIIIYDDASTPSEFQSIYNDIDTFEHCRCIRGQENKGRTFARNLLANNARYDTLLFLDADVLPLKKTFLKDYLACAKKTTVVCGGVDYEEKLKDKEHVLRWAYGKKREARSVHERNKAPYLSIISMNFLIIKSAFLNTSMPVDNQYGMDVLFSFKLNKRQVDIAHIDNPVIHLGMEKNKRFLEKTIVAMQSIALFEKEGKIPKDFRPIQRFGNTVATLRGEAIFFGLYRLMEKMILKNLNSSHPSLRLFDIFRLYHFLKARREHA